MEAAKNSVQNILSKAGHHDTTVHEKVAPAVQHETISQQQQEREQIAVDREVHQHHHHTSEQPISHQEVLPEKHHHKEIPLEHREFQHGNDEDTKRRLADGAAQYRSTQTRVDGERTKTTEPTVTGEHVHHHVHETIQPVVHKQTVEPHVVHTTVPIHEVHHNEHQHHATSALPGVTMDEFKKQGGSLKGREERQDFFPGEPKKFEGDGHQGSLGLDGHGANPKQANVQSSDASTNDHSNVRPSDTSLSNTSSTHSKPSLLDRINPKKDADGDGKAGFMK